jgi:hypothetical protein
MSIATWLIPSAKRIRLAEMTEAQHKVFFIIMGVVRDMAHFYEME